MRMLLLLWQVATSIVFSAELGQLYYVDASLSLANSPYQVISDVIISQGATLTIENGVEIIFLNHSTISVRGSIIVGCEDTNTLSNYHRGLVVNTPYTYIHGENKNGKMLFDRGATGEFCNVLFEKLSGIKEISRYCGLLSFDNCDCKTDITSSNIQNTFNDSIFSDGRVMCQGYFDNCLIKNIGTFHPVGYVYNTDIIDGGSARDYPGICVATHSVTIENSTISNCLTGISNRGKIKIKSTTISNCSTAIYNMGNEIYMEFSNITNNDIGITFSDDRSETNTVNYNNFINNTINIDNYANYDQPNVNFNYFGRNTANQSIIASKIKDICSDGYSKGLVTFWPWSITSYINRNSIVELYTFDFVGCDSINTAKSYIVNNTLQPTTSTDAPYSTVILYVRSSDSNGSPMNNLIPILLIILIFIVASYVYFKIAESKKHPQEMQIEMETEGLVESNTIINDQETETEKLIAV